MLLIAKSAQLQKRDNAGAQEGRRELCDYVGRQKEKQEQGRKRYERERKKRQAKGGGQKPFPVVGTGIRYRILTVVSASKMSLTRND